MAGKDLLSTHDVLDAVKWPESMWPLAPAVLQSLPQELIPNIDRLNTLKFPWELLQLIHETIKERLTESRISPESEIASSVSIEGPVWIEKGAKVLDFVKIVGPTYIGENALIGNFTLVRKCIICDQSIVGAHSEVARSYIGRSCWLHRNYIGDSILTDNIEVGGHSATANYRLDHMTIKSTIGNEKVDSGLDKFGSIIGSDTKIAGNCTIMPGVKIGQNCIIMSGVDVFADIADGNRVELLQLHQNTNTCSQPDL